MVITHWHGVPLSRRHHFDPTAKIETTCFRYPMSPLGAPSLSLAIYASYCPPSRMRVTRPPPMKNVSAISLQITIFCEYLGLVRYCYWICIFLFFRLKIKMVFFSYCISNLSMHLVLFSVFYILKIKTVNAFNRYNWKW